MRFNKELKQIAVAEFRRTFLNSTDLTDNTVLPENWMQEQKCQRWTISAVHLRRGDFVTSRPKESPNLDSIAKQISKQPELLNLKKQHSLLQMGQREEFNKLTQKLPQYKSTLLERQKVPLHSGFKKSVKFGFPPIRPSTAYVKMKKL
ncbi:hypothetical protein NQ317_007569 [Molorchus minor]|uniref:Uncharacterized protein n=1 Tax=Molorchus minor TaxID=1323400 RepID=A0ABQ9IQY8_9CUCU|nr:hypothetical protein NQ317_007569 [Molorchus minor]